MTEQTFGKQLRQLRLASRYLFRPRNRRRYFSHQELSDRTGIHPVYLRGLEDGNVHQPSTATLLLIAAGLGLHLDDQETEELLRSAGRRYTPAGIAQQMIDHHAHILEALNAQVNVDTMHLERALADLQYFWKLKEELPDDVVDELAHILTDTRVALSDIRVLQRTLQQHADQSS